MNSDTSTAVQETQHRYAWVILGILAMTQLVMSMGAYMWGPFAPILREVFHLSRAQIGTITSALYFASMIIGIPSGIAVDKLGARVVLVISLVVMGTPFAIMALAKGYLFFIVCTAVGGLGYGMINQISSKGIMYWFSLKFRGTAMGIKMTGVTLGGAIVAVLFPAITVAYGWRLGVLVIGMLMLAMAFLSFILFKDQPELSSGEMASDRAPTKKKSSKGSILKVMSNPVLLMLFFFVTPLMHFGQSSIASFLVLYLKEALGFSVGLAGSCLTTVMIAGTVGRVAWGVISDRLFAGDRTMPIVILSVIACVGALGTAFLSKASPVWLAFLLSALMGGTFMGWNTMAAILTSELAGKELTGSIMGIFITVGYTGLVIGPAIFGYIADRVGYFWGWLLIAVFALLIALGFLYTIQSQRRTKNVAVG